MRAPEAARLPRSRAIWRTRRRRVRIAVSPLDASAGSLPRIIQRRGSAANLLAAVLPVRGDVGARFVEVNVLVDVIDPGEWNEVVVLSVRRALLGQLDLVGSLHVVDLADGLPVRRDDVHVFPD